MNQFGIFSCQKQSKKRERAKRNQLDKEALVIKARSAFEIVRWILNSLKIILLMYAYVQKNNKNIKYKSENF